MGETVYQRELIKTINELFPGCVVIRNDPTYIQGIPDLLILFRDKWAMLEVKYSPEADIRPNQIHYVNAFDEMSFAAFIWPENEGEVLDALQSAFGVGRQARLFEPQ